ncbi:primosomal protein N' [Magnetospira sp. QH-2]|uniref:primosomal protein N' n=1 Tax=Magnetospira sp. (strain QH-2) TaxID=1288970 RepID=UPI0003E8184C|nr:primosomal protein N' [Magnetospira sp. QH-2]CCQ72364.1 Primosomal protein N' (replication factor Y) [Magnetospira sp. QH-2]
MSESVPSYCPGDLVAVMLPLPIDGPYDYRVPDGMQLTDGSLVRVPLGGRRESGVVWGPGSGELPPSKIRDILERHHPPAFSPRLRRFIEWVGGYCLARPGAVLRMAISVPEALDPPKPTAAVAAAPQWPESLKPTAARQRVMEELRHGPPRPMAELARQSGVSPGVVKGLRDAGALISLVLEPPPPFDLPDPNRGGPTLSKAQATAGTELAGRLGDGYSCTLLDGVPGSGKTEVYFEALAEALRRDEQVLVLLPEIALSAQWLDRFKQRFGCAPAVWHSDLTQATRRATWRAVAFGEARVVVGARSALFLPFPKLGLIVVDEEHDSSFKQGDGTIYNGRDMAVVRAHLEKRPIILASATPSLETVTNAREGRYRLLHLPERHGGALMPRLEVVDLTRDRPARDMWLSAALREAVEQTLVDGDQAMLFLNRRGYAPLTLCRACGQRLQCPHCTAWLVEHRLAGRLQCHHCGHQAPLPKACPGCGAEDTLAACGPGVERLAEEAAALFPQARQALAVSDTITHPRAAADLVARLERREVDLLIGTQIVAKGYHFPHLTLVGVVDGDLGLAGGDLRAAERTFQLLYQVAGRAGRESKPGRVLLQTALPNHPVMEALAAGDRDGFVAAESAAREAAGMPPFGRLAALILSATNESAVDDAAAALARAAPHGPGITVLGPAPAPLALLRGRHRRRLLLKVGRDVGLQPILRRWIASVRKIKGVRVQVDVDPYGFL